MQFPLFDDASTTAVLALFLFALFMGELLQYGITLLLARGLNAFTKDYWQSSAVSSLTVAIAMVSWGSLMDPYQSSLIEQVLSAVIIFAAGLGTCWCYYKLRHEIGSRASMVVAIVATATAMTLFSGIALAVSI